MTSNVVAGLDSSTATSYLSSHQFFKTKDEKKLSDAKLDRSKHFKDVIKESFLGIPSQSNVKDSRLTEAELISKMQDEVYATGDALVDMMSRENILAYKRAVKNFVEYILERTYDVENVITGSLDPSKKKAWTIVKVIDKKLDKLISDLMYNQLKKIDILERIDEIKGLIIDLKG